MFNILVIAQAGRLQYEAALLAASLRRFSPGFQGRLIVAEPQPGPLWPHDPRIRDTGVRDVLSRIDAEVVPFEAQHFGQSYPQGNKIEALRVMPTDAPFLFLDSDTLITGELSEVPFDFTRPSASMRRENTWPTPELYGPDTGEIWRALYTKFGLDFDSSLDPSHPAGYWQHYLYFNAGMFFGADPHDFGARFLSYALAIRDDPPPELICQSLDPWLDQVALPLVIHALGGGRSLEPGWMDGRVSCHYRTLPLLYARESDALITALEEITEPNWLKKVLKNWEPAKRMIYQGKGKKARALFDQSALPRREQAIRNRLKREGLWLR